VLLAWRGMVLLLLLVWCGVVLTSSTPDSRMFRLFSAAMLAYGASAAPTTSSLWTSGAADFPCYRQPVIAPLASAGGGPPTLLAFVEGRFSSPCAPPLGEPDVRRPEEVGGLNVRVSKDGGASWGPSKIIFGNATKEGLNVRCRCRCRCRCRRRRRRRRC